MTILPHLGIPLLSKTPTSIMAPKTRAQGPLPFSVWVRRKFRWWPGSERYGGLTDRFIIAMIIAPGVVWAAISFGGSRPSLSSRKRW